MNVALRRLRETDAGTEGVLILPEGVFCCTLELPWRDNKPFMSCIPDGQYEVGVVNTLKRGLVYLLHDVPDRSSILIHSGNYAGDTTKGLKTHVEGCILLGRMMGFLNGQRAILTSRPAVSDFLEHMDGKSFTLIVESVDKERRV